MYVLDYIAHETERQSGTVREGLGMYHAWKKAGEDAVVGRPLSESRILLYASHINGARGYRTTPVFFRSGGHAINHASIPQAMLRLSEALRDSNVATFKDHRVGYTVGFDQADALTKEFLDIHPFTDGNGRVASLIWNRLKGTLDDPQPLPYFYGEA